jgi:hypothetical protein
MTEVDEEDHVYYRFQGIEKLNLNTTTAFTLADVSSIRNEIYLCGYVVNNKNIIPFNQFLLHKTAENILVLPMITVPRKSTANILDLANEYIFKILNTKDYTYKGYNRYNGQLYLYIDFTKSNLDVNTFSRESSTIWYALVDELLNVKHVAGVPIDSNVTDYFNHFLELLFLKDSSNKSYEIPMIAYASVSQHMLSYTHAFGIKKTHHSLLGTHYYFTNYENCLNQATDGVCRFALFTQRMWVIVDNSFDYNDKWSNTVDSLQDLSGHLVAVKNHNQQVPLSYECLKSNPHTIIKREIV